MAGPGSRRSLDAVDYSEVSGFSEYELYGQWCMARYPSTTTREYFFNLAIPRITSSYEKLARDYGAQYRSVSLHSYRERRSSRLAAKGVAMTITKQAEPPRELSASRVRTYPRLPRSSAHAGAEPMAVPVEYLARRGGHVRGAGYRPDAVVGGHANGLPQQLVAQVDGRHSIRHFSTRSFRI